MAQFHSLAVGHNLSDPSTVRERLAIKVVSAAIDFQVLPPCYVKLTHGPKKLKTGTASGSTAQFDYMCSVEVHPEVGTLHVDLTKAGGVLGGKTSLGWAEVDVTSLDTFVSCMEVTPSGSDFPPRDMVLPLQGRPGETVPGHVTIQVIKVSPPRPPYSVKALIGTWNVGNAPPTEELDTWLRPEQVNHAAVIVIGSQECTYDKRAQYKDNEEDWARSISKAIGDTHAKLCMDSVGQMRLGVWVRFDVLAGIHGYESAWEATGVGHVMTNKGGVATVLSIWDTSFAFVNSHLAAHQDKVKRRNEDYCEIAGGVYLGFPNCGLLNQFHHCIWMGDLNYRLDLSSEPDVGPEEANKKTPSPFLMEKIRALAEQKAFAKLLEFDQLIKAREQGEAFLGFSEGAITHPPTFKVKRDKGIEYKDQRAPAYCDRVMWRSLPYMPASSELTWCGDGVDSSDHKPVGALLSLGMRPPRPDWWPRDSKNAHTGESRKSVHEEYHSSLFTLKHHWHEIPELTSWVIEILELSGVDLHPSDVNGRSDPYVAFLGDALLQWEATPVVYSNLNPKWDSTQLPTLTLVATSKESLRYEYLVLSCVDYDRIDADDAIGNGILVMRDLMEHLGQEQAFEADLAHAGLIRGKLRGKLKISQGPDIHMEELIKSRSKKKRFGPKQAGCTNVFGAKKELPTHGGGHGHGGASLATTQGSQHKLKKALSTRAESAGPPPQQEKDEDSDD